MGVDYVSLGHHVGGSGGGGSGGGVVIGSIVIGEIIIIGRRHLHSFIFQP